MDLLFSFAIMLHILLVCLLLYTFQDVELVLRLSTLFCLMLREMNRPN